MKRLITAVGILVGLLLIANSVVSSIYNYDRDIAKQQRIADAYIAYHNTKHIYPSSLADLISAGDLPRVGPYKEPPGFLWWNIAFNKGDYEVFPPKNNDLSSLSMLGRRNSDGKWEFNPPINAKIRDGIR